MAASRDLPKPIQSESRRAARVFVLAIANAMVLLVGVGRVYLAVHWPMDVLAGWAVGATWALFFLLLLESSRGRARTSAALAEAKEGKSLV